jgi:hypothetical protein
MAARVATAAGALLGVALTVGAAPAYAAPGGTTVEFSGGSALNLLVCKSTPSSAKVTVPSESRVTFVNRLNQTATLKVDGKSVSSVGANQAVPVVFHYGPADVSMTFSCGVGVVEEFKSVAVAVNTPAPAAPRAATPAPRTGAAAAPNGGIAARSGSSPTGGSRTGRPGGANSTAAGARAGKSAAPEDTSSAAPSAEGTVPIDPSLLGPDPSSSAFAGAVPPSAAGDDRMDVEAAVPASGTPSSGPIGLLALLATVCVVGVGIAAIRANIARRSTRASIA